MRISSYVIIKRERGPDGKVLFRAYFRGTNNRVRHEDSGMVKGFSRKADLLFALKNQPMERGVMVNR